MTSPFYLQESDILIGATVSVYVNQVFTWTLSKDPYGAQRLRMQLLPFLVASCPLQDC